MFSAGQRYTNAYFKDTYIIVDEVYCGSEDVILEIFWMRKGTDNFLARDTITVSLEDLDDWYPYTKDRGTHSVPGA